MNYDIEGDLRGTAGLTMHALIAAHADAAPDAPAIAAPGRAPLTYRGLLECLHETAGALAGLGIAGGDRVAVVLPNGPEMATAFLGMAVVASCAPLNPGLLEGEFASSFESLRVKALVHLAGADSPALSAAQRLGISLIALSPMTEAEAGRFALDGRSAAAAFTGPDDTALVLSTSGTTAKPKVVPLTHRNLCASALSIRASLALAPEDRCLNIMPLFHIHGLVGALLSSLAAGACTICSPGFNAPEFFPLVAACRPTWYSAVPTMHQAILAQAAAHRDVVERQPFRFIRSCSAALPPQVMAMLEETLGAPVIEAYGMTEAAHQMASNPLPPGARKPGSVGLPAGPEVAVMDDDGRLLPALERGEVVIRGENVMAGYADNPEANARAFTGGWFRTGDQGFLDDDGYLVLTGRIKEMINRGGEKLAPLEIDEALLDHPAVVQAVAFAVPHPQLGEEVAAAVVLRPEATLTARELRAFLASKLADFKIPRKVVFLPEIPKGPTGKIQRIGLAEKLEMLDAFSTRVEAVDYVAPRTPLEAQLAELCAGVLGLEQVGVDDNFLQLGGDSMLATLLLNRVCDAVQMTVSPIDFFEAPTVAGLALIIDKQQANREDTEMSALLTEMERLTEEEARKLLSGEM
ncbi:MAG: AMP-binding protein [Armatimonadota bacterium]